MMRKPTVLILGAGASAPYGYPLGAELVERIVQLTAPDGGGLRYVLDRDHTLRGQTQDFNHRLLRSDTVSIDDFLESNLEYADLGKLCIGAALSIWGPLPGHAINQPQNWYKYLWRHLHEGATTPQRFRENRLRIITYNYDRSFERYFAGVLEHAYHELSVAGAAAAEKFRAEILPVVHIHGALGDAADQVLTIPDRMSLNILDFHRQVAGGIRIIHEDEPSKEYVQAREWLHEAEAMYFLGFGYHPTNVKRLAPLEQIRGRSGVLYGGTAFGLQHAEILRAQSLLAFGGPTNYLYDVDALTYLRRYATLE